MQQSARRNSVLECSVGCFGATAHRNRIETRPAVQHQTRGWRHFLSEYRLRLTAVNAPLLPSMADSLLSTGSNHRRISPPPAAPCSTARAEYQSQTRVARHATPSSDSSHRAAPLSHASLRFNERRALGCTARRLSASLQSVPPLSPPLTDVPAVTVVSRASRRHSRRH